MWMLWFRDNGLTFQRYLIVLFLIIIFLLIKLRASNPEFMSQLFNPFEIYWELKLRTSFNCRGSWKNIDGKFSKRWTALVTTAVNLIRTPPISNRCLEVFIFWTILLQINALESVIFLKNPFNEFRLSCVLVKLWNVNIHRILPSILWW